MSLELYAFLDSLPDRAAWQAAIDQIGIDLKLDPELDLAKDSGFSPCEIKGCRSGFEILVEKAADVLGAVVDYPDDDIVYDEARSEHELRQYLADL